MQTVVDEIVRTQTVSRQQLDDLMSFSQTASDDDLIKAWTAIAKLPIAILTVICESGFQMAVANAACRIWNIK